MSGPVLELDSAEVSYGGPPVLTDVSLAVHPGEVVALLGPNGAGKSTSLLTLSGLLTPGRGVARVFGSPVNPRRPHLLARNGLAHVPENRELISELSVADNLKLGSLWNEREQHDVLARFPALAPLRNRRAGLLSGGEQQMLALARGMIGRPRAIMIDEASLGLAPTIVESLLPSIREFVTETGAGVLLVEQHLDVALRIADRAYVLVHGEIVIDGTTAELSQRRAEVERAYLAGASTD